MGLRAGMEVEEGTMGQVEVEGLGAASESKRRVSERWGRCLLGEGGEGMQADSAVLVAGLGAMVVFKSWLLPFRYFTMRDDLITVIEILQIM
jgi:hypothetical protein